MAFRRIGAHLSKLLAENPKSEECLMNMVTIGMARKDQAMIADYSDALLTLRPNSQTALEGLATSAFASNDYEAARLFYAKLVEYTPDNFDRWFNLGWPTRRPANRKKPPKPIRKPTRIRPDASQAYVNLGVIHQESGDLAPPARPTRKRSRSHRTSWKCCTIWRRARQAGRQGRRRAGLREAAGQELRTSKTCGSGWATCAWNAATIAAARKPSRPASQNARTGRRRT